MPTAYTSLLGLALPVTGELSGTWGNVVNDYITQYVDAAVAGAQTISGSQTAVTLSTTINASLSQAGSGATGSSQYAIINCTGNPAGQLTVTAPATSKVYLVINATSTNQSVKVVGAGPTTGVTVDASRAALIAWNGSDFALIASTDRNALNGVLTVANGGTGISSGTSGGVPYFSGSTTIASSAALAANALVIGGGAGVAPSTTTTGTGVLTAIGNTVDAASGLVTTTGAATLTNKRVNPRVVAAGATSGNLSPNGDITDVFNAFGLTGAITMFAPSGTPVDGQRLMLRFEDDGTGRGITWTTTSGAFRAVGVTLPATTIASKITYVGCVYNSTDVFWDAVAVVTQA